MTSGPTRRELIAGAVGAVGLTVLERPGTDRRRIAGRIKQSVSYWPYSKLPLAEFARAARQIGLAAIDLLQPDQWPVVADAGLVCSLGYPTRRPDFIARGFNDPANHALLLGELERTIPLAA